MNKIKSKNYFLKIFFISMLIVSSLLVIFGCSQEKEEITVDSNGVITTITKKVKNDNQKGFDYLVLTVDESANEYVSKISASKYEATENNNEVSSDSEVISSIEIPSNIVEQIIEIFKNDEYKEDMFSELWIDTISKNEQPYWG